MGDPIRCASGTGVVTVKRSFARSHVKMAFFVALGFVRFVGESSLPPTAATANCLLAKL
ncbi:MAG: hypothetical protein WBL25_21300 [Anaerolineales bacterium]